MATTKDLKLKLQLKLKELFQLDQPDLDFGFYRVMHAKQKEINEFLNEKLPKIILAAFKETDDEAIAAKKEAYEEAVRQAISFGAPDPESTEPVKAAKKVWLDAQKSAEGEADIYDHLYHFFERYYDNGDFISLRYLTRESDRKAQPYAIPYAGEEVKLHWANSDQYYIKTSENFSNYSFDAVQHPDVLKLDEMTRMAHSVPDKLKVHFSIVEAEEGEHGNIKDSKNRFFILHENKPFEIDENGEVYIYFEYREDPDKPGKEKNWQDKLRIKAIETLKQKDLPQFLLFNLNQVDDQGGERILLDIYLKRYFARNTQDYFIHKDLGGFLRRELDFYIKNELMQLDDVSAATPESVASWLNKVKVFREIASNIITFLAQLEDFQKKLWLKKKFVVQCDYCITMDRIPEQFKAEIYANEAQKAEWKRLGFDDTLPPSEGKANSEKGMQGELALERSESTAHADYRMVDTQFFSDSFKQKLISSIESLDNNNSGLIIHSENFSALSFLQNRYRNGLKSVYIDPPYNAKSSEILYKNSYRDSSWLSLMENRLSLSKLSLTKDSIYFIAIDEIEQEVLGQLINNVFPCFKKACISVVHNPRGQQGKNISYKHEFLYILYPSDKEKYLADVKRNEIDSRGLRDSGTESNREDAATCFYPFFVKNGEIIDRGKVAEDSFHPGASNISREDGTIEVWPIDDSGKEKKWRYGWENVSDIMSKLEAKSTRGKIQIIFNQDMCVVPSVWQDSKYDASEYGTKLLQKLFGNKYVEQYAKNLYPKSLFNVLECMKIATDKSKDAIILDFFGGSGTTSHAVISINRSDESKGNRKYILVEMGDHFNTVLKPRIEKVVYSPEWQDGKPLCSDKGVSHCFKYMRLESYEDTLNNLVVDKARGEGFEGIEDYLLKYMLDVETAGSASLLNVKGFKDPFNYKLTVKKPASEEREEKTVDLVETFNYLMGLRVNHIAETKAFSAEFERKPDPELPGDAHTKLLVKNLRLDQNGQWKFRTVEGWIPRNRFTPNDGAIERVLVVWRTLSDDIEKDNAVLDAYLQRNDINALDGEYDVIYVNGSNNVPNLAKDGDTWKVRLIEEDFMARMWEEE